MHRHWLALIALLLASRVVAGDEPAPRGHLVVVGGGRTNPGIIKRALDLAGGTKACVVILPQASELPDTGEKSVSLWREFGAQTVSAIKDLGDAGARREIEAASVIWMPGGDQNKLAGAIRNAGLDDLIRTRYRDGAVVGGTSAGAAVVSKMMITGEADLRSIANGATKTAEGLGIWPEVIVDQHFVKRQRFARLLGVVLDHPDKIGVGIDEETAVIVTGGEWRVIGESSVIVIDARVAQRGDTKPGAIASATGLRVHVLKAGMTWKPSAHP